ncbi:T-cell surface glycoprotein CD8 alpha chain isoform X1 [Periophthalmus magnuspinnatus]|uniref:T-cell surface glycoprotein CD8 alpha chain isoform X1 n=1 Tax=Periophthalmus magnuspinnatus TaxID=409849 RepID=UPI00145A91EA|nr:T-cell surface glycoprotein CD8 alpha chain isoform X1 [Periophthalmus magnuspinnatus]
MDSKSVFMFGILLFGTAVLSAGASAAPFIVKVNDKSPVDITCKIQGSGPTVVWFRVPDKSNLEYIASLSSVNPVVKKEGPVFHFFSTEKISAHILVLKAFNRSADAGLYSCLSQNRDMMFGGVTRLQPAEDPPTTVKTTITKKPEPPTPNPCTCPTQPVSVGQMQCSVLILAPLAGVCGLLLLTLLCTVLYCNSVRTRRCPHHYKRKPRMPAPGKQTSGYI